MPASATPDPGRGPWAARDGGTVPAPDQAAEPEGFVVEADDGTHLHFLDWGDPTSVGRSSPPVLLVPGLAQSAWSWTPVARRLRRAARVVVMDLRGHGLSDAPVDGYEVPGLAADAVAVAEGAGLLDGEDARIVLAGHGFGGAVAAGAAAVLGPRCAGLVLVDGGWESLAEISDLDPDELVHALEEPPEVLRSMAAFLADRESFDPASWDADQERAARETVVELPSRRLVPAIHPHVRDAVVDSMFAYRAVETLAAVEAPIVALAAADDEAGTHRAALARAHRDLVRLGGPRFAWTAFGAGHNLMRYRPADVAAAILGATGQGVDPGRAAEDGT